MLYTHEVAARDDFLVAMLNQNLSLTTKKIGRSHFLNSVQSMSFYRDKAGHMESIYPQAFNKQSC
jgi:hypothetical protein